MKEVGKLIAVLLSLALLCGSSAIMSFNDTEYTVTVTDKERVNKSNSSYYLVFTEDADGEVRVFMNDDNVFRKKFNSSDVQGELKIGSTYELTVVGYRVPFLSMYQNIIGVRSVDNG